MVDMGRSKRRVRGLVCDEVGRGGGGVDMGRSKRRVRGLVCDEVRGRWRGVIMNALYWEGGN